MSQEDEGDLSLLTNISQQDEFLREEFGPDIFITRSSLNANLIRIHKPGGARHLKPHQIAEGEFQIVTFVDVCGMIVHGILSASGVNLSLGSESLNVQGRSLLLFIG
jgi:hypothetical protein